MTQVRSKTIRDLPPGVIVRKRPSADYYYYQTTSVGQKRREYALGKVKSVALAKWREIAAELPPAKRKVGLRPWLGVVMHGAVSANAKRRGLEFSLSVEDINDLLTQSKGRCAVSGIEFDLFKDPAQRVRHWAPSLDRVDCKQGYVVGNVRIVANAVNVALSDFGESVLLRIAKGMVKKKYGKIV